MSPSNELRHNIVKVASFGFTGSSYIKQTDDEGLTLKDPRNVSFRVLCRWPIHIINPVDKTKLSR